MEYSGRTTAYGHNGPLVSAIRQETIFEVQWTDCPVEVEEEVKKLWVNYELGNDYYYYSWDSVEDGPDYPIIDEYLKSKNITKCLIHWWW